MSLMIGQWNDAKAAMRLQQPSIKQDIKEMHKFDTTCTNIAKYSNDSQKEKMLECQVSHLRTTNQIHLLALIHCWY